MSCLYCLTHTTSEEPCYIRSSCEYFAMNAALLSVLLVQLFVSLPLSHIVFQTLLPWWTFYTALFVYGKYYVIKKIKTWPKFRGVTAPALKFRVVSRPPCPRLGLSPKCVQLVMMWFRSHVAAPHIQFLLSR